MSSGSELEKDGLGVSRAGLASPDCVTLARLADEAPGPTSHARSETGPGLWLLQPGPASGVAGAFPVLVPL